MDRNLISTNEEGSSLLVVVLALGLLSAFIMTWGMKDKSQLAMRDSSRFLSSRHKLSRMIARYAKMKPSIRNSVRLGNNPLLEACLLEQPSCPTGKPATELRLFGPIYDATMIAGDVANPVAYDAFGTPCTGAPSASCPLEAVAYFVPLCPGQSPTGAPVTCTKPDRLYIMTRIRMRDVPGMTKLADEVEESILKIDGLVVP